LVKGVWWPWAPSRHSGSSWRTAPSDQRRLPVSELPGKSHDRAEVGKRACRGNSLPAGGKGRALLGARPAASEGGHEKIYANACVVRPLAGLRHIMLCRPSPGSRKTTAAKVSFWSLWQDLHNGHNLPVANDSFGEPLFLPQLTLHEPHGQGRPTICQRIPLRHVRRRRVRTSTGCPLWTGPSEFRSLSPRAFASHVRGPWSYVPCSPANLD
jgi:hypothetical protein